MATVVTEFSALLPSPIDLPTPGYGEALVKLETSGVCHTELHAAQGDWPVKPQPPFVPGHEGYGTVVAVGEVVNDLKIGDKVGNAWLWSACGRSEYCLTGWETLCERQKNGGYSVDGSFGTYMLVNADYAARIPDGADPLEVAPILCAGVTVYKSPEGHRDPARPVCGDLRYRRARTRRRARVRWECGWLPSISTTQNWRWP